jgi:hypothetical protein
MVEAGWSMWSHSSVVGWGSFRSSSRWLRLAAVLTVVVELQALG